MYGITIESEDVLTKSSVQTNCAFARLTEKREEECVYYSIVIQRRISNEKIRMQQLNAALSHPLYSKIGFSTTTTNCVVLAVGNVRMVCVGE